MNATDPGGRYCADLETIRVEIELGLGNADYNEAFINNELLWTHLMSG